MLNNDKKYIFERNNMTKSPIIRRCRTSNNLDLNRFNINLNNFSMCNNYNQNLFSNNKYIFDKTNIINNQKIEHKNSVKHSVTNDGSTVSIYGNTINGLPILKGVCSKCINNELIKLKNINQRLYTYNNIKNSRINDLQKDKLLEQNSNSENELNKQIKERIKGKVIINCLKKEQYIKNIKYNQYMKTEVDKYLSNGNKITKFSVPSIGLEKFKNKYLPTKDQYINTLNEQIIQKKKSEEKIRKKEKDEFNYFTNKNKIKAELEEESRINKEKQKMKELLKENQKLAQMRKQKELRDKSTDIALQKKYDEIMVKKDKEEIEMKKNIKLRIKRNLKEKLDEQILNKLKRNNSFDFRKRIKRVNSRNTPDISDINIYTENKISLFVIYISKKNEQKNIFSYLLLMNCLNFVLNI